MKLTRTLNLLKLKELKKCKLIHILYKANNYFKTKLNKKVNFLM